MYENVYIYYFIPISASDNDIEIYTIATCGTDHLVKIWRVFYLDNQKKSRDRQGNSRLLPILPQHISGTSTIFSTETMNTECILTIPAHGSSVTSVR